MPGKPTTFTLTEADTRLLPKLQRNYREILGYGTTYKEIASALNVPVGTVRSRLHRARAALQRLRDEAHG